MNLIPLPYLKVERYRKWLKKAIVVSLLIGALGSGISILLPFKIYSLQEEVVKLKQEEVLSYKKDREKVLEGIYEKEQFLKVLDEERQKLNIEKEAYFLDIEHVFCFSPTLIKLYEVSYHGLDQEWKVVGTSHELEYIKLYKENLLKAYGEEKLRFQMEKADGNWYFSFRLVQSEEALDEALE